MTQGVINKGAIFLCLRQDVETVTRICLQINVEFTFNIPQSVQRQRKQIMKIHIQDPTVGLQFTSQMSSFISSQYTELR